MTDLKPRTSASVEGDVSLGQYIRNTGMNSPFGAAYAFQDA
jgi:hypothetical protein